MKHLLALVAMIVATPIFAQITQGGEPFSWNEPYGVHHDFETMSTLDLDLLRSQDEVTDQYKEAPYRFGVEHSVSFSPANTGGWNVLEDGTQIWQMAIECPEALSISFLFDEYELPKGARLFIWAADRTQFLGSYNHENNKEAGSFAVGLIYTDQVVIELQVDEGVSTDFPFHLSQVVHGYRDILNKYFEVQAERGPFGNSGACNINVNCPEADEWQIEKRSVALIVSGGFAVCSGAMVNNTAQDGTPYFLTANHCLGGETNWVFYFNHEAANCNGNTGPTDQSISGSTLKASNSGSDFGLLELSEEPPADFDVQYSGWDATDDESVVNATGIHHPSGDVKKICFEDDDPYHANQAGAAVWYIDEWELGVTEGGSSGSPLFDHNHRIIGQLYGGFAACSGPVNNGQADWYGRFGVSWDGNSASSRLRDWLDPSNSGAMVLDGWPEGFVAFENDASVNSIQGIEDVICDTSIEPSFNIRNNGTETLTSATIHYQLNDDPEGTIDWTGSLEQYEQEEVDIPELMLADGDNTFTAWVTDPNGVPDENENNNQAEVEFEAITGDAFDYTLNIILDDYGSEITWEVKQGGNVLYSGGPYPNDADQQLETRTMCLNDGCYTFTIFDSFGDGICCEYGEGSYELIDPMGDTVVTGGEYGDDESTFFCTMMFRSKRRRLRHLQSSRIQRQRTSR
jgi:lysyl endopeptidase